MRARVRVCPVLTMTPTPPTKLKHPATVPCRPAGAREATSAWLVTMLGLSLGLGLGVGLYGWG